MKLPEVSLVQRGYEHRFTDTAQLILSEVPALIRVVSPKYCRVLFNDEELNLVWAPTGVGVGTIDLTHQVGFNRITCILDTQRFHYDFFTESARFTWLAIQAMAFEVVEQIYRFAGQFVYSLPEGGPRRTVHSPQIEFGWIREYLPEIELLVHAVARNPARQRVRRIVTSFKGGRPSVRHTSALLREHPEFLEPAPDGPVLAGINNYWPSCVKIAIASTDIAEQEHREIHAFLNALLKRCEVLIQTTQGNPRAIAARYARSLQILLGLRLFARFRSHLTAIPSPIPTALQRTDPRYRRLRDLFSLYTRDYLTSEVAQGQAVRVNIADAWEIYQTYAAHRVGFAFGLNYAARERLLRKRNSLKRSMASTRYDLYYDLHPPRQLLRSWRDESERSASERPDILLHDRQINRLALLEVKFRSEAQGLRANSDDVFEVQGYLNSFGLKAAGLIFPGSGSVREIAGGGNLILEIPLGPQSANIWADTLRAVIGRIWQPSQLV